MLKKCWVFRITNEGCVGVVVGVEGMWCGNVDIADFVFSGHPNSGPSCSNFQLTTLIRKQSKIWIFYFLYSPDASLNVDLNATFLFQLLFFNLCVFDNTQVNFAYLTVLKYCLKTQNRINLTIICFRIYLQCFK